MKEINNAAELAEFAGNIVSFESARIFSTPESCFPIAGKMIAYIGENCHRYQGGEQGFRFSILCKSQEDSIFHTALTNSGLKNKSLKVSLATEEEINLIKESLLSGKAHFASGDWKLDEILETDAVPYRP